MFSKTQGLLLTLATFILTSMLITCSIYLLIPFIMATYKLSFAVTYLGCFYIPFVLLFLLALVLYKAEGNLFTPHNFTERFRLHKIDRKTAIWLGVFFIIILIGYFAAAFLSQLISDNISFLSVPDFFPAGLNHNKELVKGYFFDIELKGKWWFALIYFIGWFFNIFGEELLFRGFLLPLNEKSFGKQAWIFQGILWGFWHLYWFWQFIPLTIFVSLPLLFVTQKTKNTWVAIIIHGLLNFVPLVYIISQIW